MTKTKQRGTVVSVPQFEHKGVTITMTPHGEFEAKINGIRTVKPSIDAMRKAIDAAARKPFVPFTALTDHHHSIPRAKRIDGTDLRRVSVVGLMREKARGRYTSRSHNYWFRVEGTPALVGPNSIYADTPETIAAYRAYRDQLAAAAEREAQDRAKTSELRAALKRHQVDPEKLEPGGVA